MNGVLMIRVKHDGKGQSPSLWNSYAKGFGALSKSYAHRDNSRLRSSSQGAARTAGCPQLAARPIGKGAEPMLDVILLIAGLAFFALSIAYAFGCDSL